jgi:hypothetical protein
LGYANYLVQLQHRKGRFQPYVKGTIGAARSNFGGLTFANGRGLVGSGNQFTYGGGAGLDIKLGKKTKWRTGFAVTKAFGKDTGQLDAKAVTGLVFDF